MNVISLITLLRISTNYTTIYRGHGAENAAIAHFRSGIVNEVDERNQTKSNKRTKAVTCQLQFNIRFRW